VLDWDARNLPAGQRRLSLVRDLLAIRRREIVPRLAGAIFGNADAADNGLLTASWRLGDGAALRLTANLSAGEIARERTDPTGTSIWGGESSELLPPWSVFWRIGAR
jgi:maltooligosyltrehalose trehalohydrolase